MIYKAITRYDNYRRHNVINYFSKKSDVITIDNQNKEWIEDYENRKDIDIIFFEGPSIYANEIAERIPHKKVIFDRTDNWTANSVILEEWLLNNADVIINTSKWLFNNSSNHKQAKCYYIPSATNDLKYKHNNQLKIAVYAGFNTKKIDKEAYKDLIDNNPTWKFISIGAPLRENIDERIWDKKAMTYEQCLFEMGKFKVGIVLLNDSDWANGMLCLKIFDYIKAGLAVVTNSPNVSDDIPNIIKWHKGMKLNDIDFSKLTDIVPDKYLYKTTLKQIEDIVYDK